MAEDPILMYTPPPIPQLVVEAIQNPRVPAPVLSALAEALLTDIQYGSWSLSIKDKIGEETLLRMLEEYEVSMRSCQEAWFEYTREFSADTEEALLQRIAQMRDLLHRQMSGGT